MDHVNQSEDSSGNVPQVTMRQVHIVRVCLSNPSSNNPSSNSPSSNSPSSNNPSSNNPLSKNASSINSSSNAPVPLNQANDFHFQSPPPPSPRQPRRRRPGAPINTLTPRPRSRIPRRLAANVNPPGSIQSSRSPRQTPQRRRRSATCNDSSGERQRSPSQPRRKRYHNESPPFCRCNRGSAFAERRDDNDRYAVPRPAVSKEAPRSERSEKEPRDRSPLSLGRCAICLGSFEAQHIVSTRCGHVFCEDCLIQALRRDKKCPTCRTVLRGRTAYHSIFLQ